MLRRSRQMSAAEPPLVASRPSATVLPVKSASTKLFNSRGNALCQRRTRRGHCDDARCADRLKKRHPHRYTARSTGRFSQAGRHLLWRADRSHRVFPRRVRRTPAMARRDKPMPIWWRCASSCLAPPAAKSGFPSASCGPATAAALAAWTGFTLPSATILVLFAYGAGDARWSNR